VVKGSKMGRGGEGGQQWREKEEGVQEQGKAPRKGKRTRGKGKLRGSLGGLCPRKRKKSKGVPKRVPGSKEKGGW